MCRRPVCRRPCLRVFRGPRGTGDTVCVAGAPGRRRACARRREASGGARHHPFLPAPRARARAPARSSKPRRRARVGTASVRSGVIVSHSRHDTRSVQHTLIFLLLNGATGSTEKIQQNQHKKYNLQCISNVFKYISSCGKAGRKNRAALSPPTGEARFPCVSYLF